MTFETRDNIAVRDLQQLLEALDIAYSAILEFVSIVDAFQDYSERLRDLSERLSPEQRFEELPWWIVQTLPPIAPFGPLDLRRSVAPGNALVVARIEMASPGIWEFLGTLNPLEVVRQYLNDRHRRRQDREYREYEEARQLELENDRRFLENRMLENQVVAERIQTLAALGLSENEQRRYLDSYIMTPLAQLDFAQDRLAIDEVYVEEVEPEEVAE